MKQYVFFLLLAFSLAASAQKNNTEAYLTQSLANANIKKVVVETSGGSISVSGVSPSEAKIEVHVRANNNESLSREEIKRRLEEDYEVIITVENNTASAKARPKEKNLNWRRALSISFEVHIPENASTRLSTSGGSIHLENLTGKHEFTTSGGSLHVEDVQGNISGRTSGGSIHAEQCSGTIDLATSGGSLHLERLDGKIKAATSGGSINGESISGEFMSHTSGGSIRLSELSCSLEASTSGGHIDVSVKELGKYLTIRNAGGNIDLRLPRNKSLGLNLRGNRVNTAALSNFNGHTEKTEIKGIMNGGGVPVTVDAGGGRIDLRWN